MLTCDYSEQIAGDVKVWKGEQVTQETQLSVIYFRTDTQQTWRLFVSVFLNLSLNFSFPAFVCSAEILLILYNLRVTST